MRPLLTLLAAGALSVPASAVVVLNTWQVSAAFVDAYGQYSDGHAVWFANEAVPGGGRAYAFTGGLGTLENRDTDLDGFGDELLLYGRIESNEDPDYAYDVQMAFSGAPPGAMSPKRELRDNAYVDQGGPVDPGTWSYFVLDESRTLFTGVGAANAGADIQPFDFPTDGSMPFQLGFGANGKNVGFGLSGWFGFIENGHEYKGDVNIDVVPEPASLALLFTGLGVLARRRA